MKYEQKLGVNQGSKRLELDIDGSTAFIEYKLSEPNLFLIHTEVPTELEGKGVGSAIVEKSLQYAKDNNYKIVPLCPFVQAFLKRHNEWSEIIAADSQKFIKKP